MDTTDTLDATGLNCPMPVVKTRQATENLAPGDTLAVRATDPGSVSDIAGWADSTADVELLDQTEDGDVYVHYLRKTDQ